MSEERDELLALGAVGALTPEETAELERMLATDPAAAAEYAALVDDATALAESVAEPPPPALRASVLSAIAAEAQDTADAPAPLPPPSPPLAAEEEDPTTPIAPVVPIHRRRWWIPATAVAAAIVLVVGALVVTRDADAPTDDELMAEVLDDDEAVTVELSGDDAGTLRLVKSEEHDATVLVGDGIARPGDREVLQLWSIRGDEAPHDMGTFVPDDDGHVAYLMTGAEPEGAVYAVTMEPAPGSEQPTSEPIYGPA
jgi:anti-sigma-K factor RskA